MVASSAVSGAAAGPALGGDNFAADTPPRLSPNGTEGSQPAVNCTAEWLQAGSCGGDTHLVCTI